jgi:iron-sulfur cluster repair protein YtfE (RIC family)
LRRNFYVSAKVYDVKRHPALIPLSHDHRQGLFLAQILRPGPPRYPGMPATPLTKQTYALSLSSELLEPHMHAEETLLEPLIVGRDAEIDALLARLRAEHVSLREQIQALPHVAAAELEAALHEFGQALEAHIRTEERQLFQRIQALDDEELMGQIGERFAAYRRAVCLPRPPTEH